MLDISNTLNLETPSTTVLYAIEEAIKAYRNFSLQHIKKVISDITVDQALVLLMVHDKQFTQTEIADLIFKDYASMTRIIGLMIKKDYILKSTDVTDKRIAVLRITPKGAEAVQLLLPIIHQNRKTALNGLSMQDLEHLKSSLHKITKNCTK